MRSNLYVKFIILYIIFGFLSLFTTATLGSHLIFKSIERNDTSALYREASILASDYLPDYFTEYMSASDTRILLKNVNTYLDADLWLTDTEGKVLLTVTTGSLGTVPSQIRNFDPAESGNDQYLSGTYHGYFDEDVVTIITPVTKGFSTNGYLLLHKPLSVYDARHHSVMNAVYITLLAIYVLSFVLFLGIHFFIYMPLRKITEAAKQYASGNLEYEIPVYFQDEIGYLSASLNYMASHLKDMEDYQKKFVANVSHDFRSPLTSIKGYVEAMADGTIPPELQGKYLNIILFETERLTDLTRDLLTLNEFDTKDLLLNKESFDIHEVIKNVAASFEGTCTKRKISIELLLASQILNVHADRRKIQQVLYNLLDNAIKFSNPNSSVTVETTERGEKVFVSVRDYGIGIPKEDLNRIWERFYKSDLSRGKDKKGTGLGLAIVKEIIQAHNENINVISTEGVGTEFIFSLPRT
ncbi:MAG: sensor histidine kinase [Sellimonas sp.]|uniref:sensor histidine kinase n=1 Tax=Sellimonas sp. TaxID=2021466 RepID=UPI002599AC89|nr:HAMP domain-containing sensor histidine kinase [uncultured Sellimonas sp.]